MSLAPLRRAAAEREASGMRRRLRPRPADDDVLDLASNDYLGLARDQRVTSAAADAALRWGAGATGSRLVTGSTELHAELERDLADFVGAPAGLVFSSGYLANLGAVTALAGPGASWCPTRSTTPRWSTPAGWPGPRSWSRRTATSRRWRRHWPGVRRNAPSSSPTRCSRSTATWRPVAELHATARAHGALLVVDEAHSLGVVGEEGRGACHQAGIAGQDDVVVTATLSKSLGAQGGAVLGNELVVEHLVNTARSFIFDTALAPAAAGAAGAALAVLRAEPGLAGAVRARARSLAADLGAAGLPVTHPDGAVVSVLVGEPGRAADAAAAPPGRGPAGRLLPPAVGARRRLAAAPDRSRRPRRPRRRAGRRRGRAGPQPLSRVRMVRSATDSVARSKVSEAMISPRVAWARATPSSLACSQSAIRWLGELGRRGRREDVRRQPGQRGVEVVAQRRAAPAPSTGRRGAAR